MNHKPITEMLKQFVAHTNRNCKLSLTILLFISFLPLQSVQSDLPSPGVYIGDFMYWPYGSPNMEIKGKSAIFVPGTGPATIANFPTPTINAFADISSSVINNVDIREDETFEKAFDFTCMIGQFNNDLASGDYYQWTGGPDPDLTCGGSDWGDFSLTRTSNIGSLTDGGGFYTGTISGEVIRNGEHWADVSGDLAIMFSGDGTAFVAADVCALDGPICTIIDDGGIIQVADDGTIFGVLDGGAVVSGFFDSTQIGTSACCTAQGTSFASSGDFVSSATWTVTRDIALPNNLPPSAIPDNYSTKINQALTIATPGVLSNDNDENGDQIQSILVNKPSHGSLDFKSDGSFLYQPINGYRGTDNFTYQTTDGLLKSAPVLVTLLVGNKSLPWLHLLLD